MQFGDGWVTALVTFGIFCAVIGVGIYFLFSWLFSHISFNWI